MRISAQLPRIILVVGTIVTLWGAWSVQRQIDHEAESAFASQVKSFETTLIRRLRSYEDILFGVAGLFRSRDGVTMEEFEAYATSLNAAQRYPALAVINFARYGTRAQRDAFVRDFERHTEGRKRLPLAIPESQPEFMVITHLYPSKSPGLGLDIVQNARQRARDPSAPPILVTPAMFPVNAVYSSAIPFTPPGNAPPGIAARLGVYRPDPSGNEVLIGSAGIGFTVPALFAEALPPQWAGQLRYRVDNLGRTSGARHEQPVLVHRSSPAPVDDPPRGMISASFAFDFGGADLQGTVQAERSSLVNPWYETLPPAVLLFGALLTVLLSVLSRRTLHANGRLETAVAARTSELRAELERVRELEREVARIADDEQRRIGNELHDDLGQRLTGMSLAAAALAADMQAAAPHLHPRAKALERSCSECISEVRKLAHGLLPVAEGPSGLREALAQLAVDVQAMTGVACSFDFDDPVDIDDSADAAHLYRIAQEAVSNAIRHGNAARIDLRLDYMEGKVMLSIQDDGIGFDCDADKTNTGLWALEGAGMRVMRYRASVIGYRLAVESKPGTGTCIRVTQC
ncbi:MAG TPA: ATP-binding protein [Noviherbaspirillum sp.]|nr:ATP-binding protein [Noviherbaspirillum sp.]